MAAHRGATQRTVEWIGLELRGGTTGKRP